MREVSLDRLQKAKNEAVYARIYPGHQSHRKPRFVGSGYGPPQDFWSFERPAVAPVDVIAYPNVEVRSDHMPHKYRKPITSARVFHPYVADIIGNSSVMRAYNFPVVEAEYSIDDTVFCVTHVNVTVYGHFLLEVLPKLLVAQRLIMDGLDAKIVFPVNVQPGIFQAACAASAPIEIVGYDATKTRLRLARGLLISSVASAMYDFNDSVLAIIKELGARLSNEQPTARIPGPRIFLSRRDVKSFRKLTNEAELFAVAARHGFELVQPHLLPWADQVRMFQRASYVIGEYTSALHGTLFCRPAAKVISLGYLQDVDVQSAIAAAAGFELGYLLPGNRRTVSFQHGWTETQEFAIEPDDLRRCLEDIT